MKKSNKIFKGILIGFFVILFLAIVVLLVYGLVFKKESRENVQFTAKEDDDFVVWRDEKYVYNDHLSNYLFIGIDEYTFEDENGESQTAASDALYLLSYDRMTGDMELVSIPRDTMTEIETFLADGTSAGYSRNHISLSYSFGDGKHKSCRLTKDAVSDLFYGLSVNGYCAMSMAGLAVIPEVIGSFDVVVPNDSLSGLYEGYEEGSTVTITSENSELFVRSRDINIDHSAIDRQERQVAYLEAAYEKIGGVMEKNPEVIVELYDALEPYLVTNMGTELFVDLADAVYAGNTVNIWTVPGEAVEGKNYDEYHVDENALYEQIMVSFYKRVKK